jgi:hypothetical protein
MTGTIPPNGTTDPERLFENGSIDAEERTYTHGDEEHYRDHCEIDTVGRAIVGVTDADDRPLLVVDSENGHAILPNDIVAPDEDWGTVGRNWVEDAAGIDPTIDDVRRVRQVEHAVEGESTPRSTVYQVVFGASIPSMGSIPDGLCADNPFELGWHDTIPVAMDDAGAGVLDDIRLFLDRSAGHEH